MQMGLWQPNVSRSRDPRCPNEGNLCFCTGVCIGAPSAFRSGGQIWDSSAKVKVRKRRGLWTTDTKLWVVTNHVLGTKSFTTWQAAMFYANTRPVMMNGALVDA